MMTYLALFRRAGTCAVKGCGTCGGGGRVGGSANRPCPACNGGGKSAIESRGGRR